MAYTFREIKEAVCAVGAGRKAKGFPYGTDWRDTLSRVKGEPAFAALLEEIREEAERAVREPVPQLSYSLFNRYEKAGTRFEYERPYFDRRRRLLGLLFATLIDETDRHLPALEDLLWEICGEYTWCLPAHLPLGIEAVQAGRRTPPHAIDLFAAETAQGLAEVLYLLGDKLNPWISFRVRSELEERTFHPLFHDPVPFDWETATHNWSAVCAGAVGMAALLTVEDPERLAGMMDRINRAMECYLEGFEEDGGCPEGIGYWAYGFGYYMYFAEMLESYTAGHIRLLDGDKLRRIAAFPLAVSLSENSFVNYSDAPSRCSLHTGMVSRLVKRYGIAAPYMESVPSLHLDHCYRFPHTSRNLLWTDTKLLGSRVPSGSWELEDIQWVVNRRRYGEGMVAFSAKGGHNAEPHNHNDLGNFILHAGGESLLIDLGAGVYTKDYFGEKRYTYLHNAGRGHSVPVIDGVDQRPGPDCRAIIKEKEIGDSSVYLALDLTSAYPMQHLSRYTRTFDWSAEPAGAARLELVDRFDFTQPPETLEEAFISGVEPVLESGVIHWKGSAGAVSLHYDGELYKASVEVIPTKEHLGEPITVYRLVLQPVEMSDSIYFAARFDIRAE
jgi:hypothetical protein